MCFTEHTLLRPEDLHVCTKAKENELHKLLCSERLEL